jgi:hypothetical protein
LLAVLPLALQSLLSNHQLGQPITLPHHLILNVVPGAPLLLQVHLQLLLVQQCLRIQLNPILNRLNIDAFTFQGVFLLALNLLFESLLLNPF